MSTKPDKKTHLMNADEPHKAGGSYRALCGKEIKSAVFNFQCTRGEKSPHGLSTLLFCSKCIDAAASGPTPAKHYLYGMREGEEAKQEEVA